MRCIACRGGLDGVRRWRRRVVNGSANGFVDRRRAVDWNRHTFHWRHTTGRHWDAFYWRYAIDGLGDAIHRRHTVYWGQPNPSWNCCWFDDHGLCGRARIPVQRR